MITDAELILPRLVSMTRAIHIFQCIVVRTFRISIPKNEADRGTERCPIQNATEELDLVGFVPCSSQRCASRATTIQFQLHRAKVQDQTCRTSIDDTTDRRAMALTKGGQAEDVAKRTAGHVLISRHKPVSRYKSRIAARGTALKNRLGIHQRIVRNNDALPRSDRLSLLQMKRLLIKNTKGLVGTHPADLGRVAGRSMKQLPIITDGWLTAENGRITGLGSMDSFPGITDWSGLTVIDATGRYVLPGWCDPHTHTVFAASREEEFVDKINGLTYQQIAARGGGILNSAAKLRTMSEDELFDKAKTRLELMVHQGTVAVEIKSGYGLSLESELKMLRVAKRLKESMPMQIRTTLLAAHALPLEFKEDREAYVQLILNELIPQVKAEGLAEFVDVFCETNYFTVAEMERILDAGKAHGLVGKVHVNQFTSIGGIQAAVKCGALSVDHLEVMEQADIAALVGSNTIPTLLPSCSFFIRIPYGPARQLMDHDLPLALATDFNPGTTPSGNMNFVLSLACVQLRMLPEEAINAMTLNSAAAMGIEADLGSISVGKRASLIITKEVPSLTYLPYAFGNDNIDTVLIDGTPVRSGASIA